MHKTGRLMMAVAVCVAMETAVTVYASDKTTSPAPVTTTIKHQTLCPIMGGEINKSFFVDTDGKRIYVCCGMCVNTVKKDPAKYVKLLEAEGITLDKATPAKP